MSQATFGFLSTLQVCSNNAQAWVQVGAESFRMCRELLDGVLMVDNRAISGAIEAVFNDKRSILEPAGAVAVAGATQYIERHDLQVKSCRLPPNTSRCGPGTFYR